jgi:hypothetical protein
MALLDAEENGKDLEKDFPVVFYNEGILTQHPWLIVNIDDDSDEGSLPAGIGSLIALLNRMFPINENEKILMKSAAQSAEFSLRTIKERLSKSANNPNCDDKCQAYNTSKMDAVDVFHEEFVDALNAADVPLLQTRIPG